MSADAELAALRVELSALQGDFAELKVVVTQSWLLLCTSLVLFMQAGFALLESGSCRSRNVLSIFMKNQVDSTISIIAWYVCGWGLAFGPSAWSGGLFGNTGFFGSNLSEASELGLDSAGKYHFSLAFAAVSTTIVSGGIAERSHLTGYLAFCALMSGFIYPTVACWCWGTDGWLKVRGFFDFAGSGVVHLTGGVGALCGAWVVGPRHGRFASGDPIEFSPHSVPFVQLGTLVLWFGWYGFNAGSVTRMAVKEDAAKALLAAMNTTFAGAGGGAAVLVLQACLWRKYSVPFTCNGILVGLVSITASCSIVTPLGALLVGAIAVFPFTVCDWLLQKLHIDDPVSAFPVHGVGGAWGVIAASLFHSEAAAPGTPCPRLGVQLLAILCISTFVAVFATVFFRAIVHTRHGRASEDLQRRGMDNQFSTMAYSNGDVTRFRIFLSHVKDSHGATARWLQLELSGFVGGRSLIFLDSDNLVNLNTMMATVRDMVDVLVVLVSDDIWRHPWCAGEIAAAYLSNVPVVLVTMDGGRHLPAAFFEGLRKQVPALLSQRDMETLAPFGIDRAQIQEAYAALRDAKQVPLTAGRYEDGVRRIAVAGGFATTESSLVQRAGHLVRRIFCAEGDALWKARCASDSYSTSVLLILGNSADIEAVAAMHICKFGLLQVRAADTRPLAIVASSDLPEATVLQMVANGANIALILSRNVLLCPLVQRAFVLCAAGDRHRTAEGIWPAHPAPAVKPRDIERSVLLIHADRLGFEFPSKEFYHSLQQCHVGGGGAPRPREGPLTSFDLPFEGAPDVGVELAGCYKSVFQLIALPLSTHGSWHSIQHQLCSVCKRTGSMGSRMHAASVKRLASRALGCREAGAVAPASPSRQPHDGDEDATEWPSALFPTEACQTKPFVPVVGKSLPGQPSAAVQGGGR